MMPVHANNYPRLHNAAWPGLVGKDPKKKGSEPISLETMLDMTAAAKVNGVKFDGVDVFLYHPHFDIDGGDEETKRLAQMADQRNLKIGTVVAPIYGGMGGGSPIGKRAEQGKYLSQVRKACAIAEKLRRQGIRPHGNVRIDTGIDVPTWAADPEATQKIVKVFRQACDIAEAYGEKLVGEPEICWGAMHTWRKMVELLERVERPDTFGCQSDMSHTLLFLLGFNAPDEHALLPQDFDFSRQAEFDAAYQTMTDALRPWTTDLHIAQNDGTAHGAGSHDRTGRHCLPNDPRGKLDITRHAGYWLRQGDPKTGPLHKRYPHVCWDGCMFPNDVMMKPQTWNDILAAMIAVRDAHGWREEE